MSAFGYIIIGIAVAIIGVLGFLLLKKNPIVSGTPAETAKAQAAMQTAVDALAQRAVIIAKTEEEKLKLDTIMKIDDTAERLKQLAEALKGL
jgi:hypothetical protein